MGGLGGVENEHPGFTQLSFSCASPTPGEGWHAHSSSCVLQRVHTPHRHFMHIYWHHPPLLCLTHAAGTAFRELTVFPVPSSRALTSLSNVVTFLRHCSSRDSESSSCTAEGQQSPGLSFPRPSKDTAVVHALLTCSSSEMRSLILMDVAREGGTAKCLSMRTLEHSLCSQIDNYSVLTIDNCLPTFLQMRALVQNGHTARGGLVDCLFSTLSDPDIPITLDRGLPLSHSHVP